MGTTTIGKAATKAGVNVETIRFYERRGLINQPPRRDGAYRHYSDDSIARIRFIRSMKKLGFRLSEIKNLMWYLGNNDIDCIAAEEMSFKKITEINEKIVSLETMKRALLEFKNQCADKKPDGMCILNDLYQPRRSSEAIST